MSRRHGITGRLTVLALVLAGAATLTGCKGKERGAAAESAAIGARTSPSDTTSRAGTATADTGAARMSDANILAKLREGDRKEVALAREVEGKLTSPDVKRYARQLARDHARGEREVTELARKLELAIQPPPGDTGEQELAHLERRFHAMTKGAALDSAFVSHEIEDHQRDIADAKAMQAQAKARELRQLIEKEIPVLQQHLDSAQALIGRLGSARG